MVLLGTKRRIYCITRENVVVIMKFKDFKEKINKLEGCDDYDVCFSGDYRRCRITIVEVDNIDKDIILQDDESEYN